MAERYALEGKKEEAAEIFASLGEYSRAARLAAEMGDERRTVEWSLKGALAKVPKGLEELNPQQAAEFLATSGHHAQAIPLFEVAQDFRKAADSAIKIHQLTRAAKLLERGGAWEEASRLYQKVDLPENAAQALGRAAERIEQDLTAGRDATMLERLRRINSQRIGLLVQLGREEEAEALRRDVHPAVQRGRGLEKSGLPAEAIEAYLEADRPDLALELVTRRTVDRRLAAEVYLRAGRHLEAGHLFVALGDARAAAQAYEGAGDWERAGRQWELGRDPVRAAQSFQRIGRTGEAARCFILAGQPALAALAFAKLGDFKSAADCYLRAGQPLEAARQLLAAGARTQAARTLIAIQPEAPEGEQATLLLVPLLVEEGFFDDALRRLRQTPAGPMSAAIRSEALDRLYWEGKALEGLGRNIEAREVYRRLAEQDFDYPGVAARLAAVEALLAPARSVAARAGEALRRPGDDSRAVATLGSGEMPAPLPKATPAPGPTPAPTPAGERQGSSGSLSGGNWQVPRVGERFAGRYQLLSELGRGGMGRVYKALDLDLGVTVAIKTLLSPPDQNPIEADRLLREIQICRQISHPNIVRVFDLGRFRGGIFITMEYLEGQSLDLLIDRQKPLPLSRLRELLSEIAAGLEEAHSMGIIHRDLKPTNLVVTATRLKILDFGLAQMAGFDHRLTQTGFIIGTPMYMSPEMVLGKPLDARSDLYSLGVIAYTMIAGQEPFDGPAPTAIAIQQVQAPPPDIRRFRSTLPQPWIEFIDRLLAKDPEQRYANAREVATALAALPD
jgi:tetratricopeptide (TPR) repeat protein/predicted Ser/Thr protein kinase